MNDVNDSIEVYRAWGEQASAQSALMRALEELLGTA